MLNSRVIAYLGDFFRHNLCRSLISLSLDSLLHAHFFDFFTALLRLIFIFSFLIFVASHLLNKRCAKLHMPISFEIFVLVV